MITMAQYLVTMGRISGAAEVIASVGRIFSAPLYIIEREIIYIVYENDGIQTDLTFTSTINTTKSLTSSIYKEHSIIKSIQTELTLTPSIQKTISLTMTVISQYTI